MLSSPYFFVTRRLSSSADFSKLEDVAYVPERKITYACIRIYLHMYRKTPNSSTLATRLTERERSKSEQTAHTRNSLSERIT